MSKRNAAARALGERTPERLEAEERAIAELDAWRERTLPDPSAPLDADALARLVLSCFESVGIDASDFSVNTVHYYRRKDILDAPAGRTSAARYDLRHVWQAAGARLAGHLGLVTLAEARDTMRGADERTLVSFVAARVVDARARANLRKVSSVAARPLPGVYATVASSRSRPADAPLSSRTTAVPAMVVSLPGEAWCVIPANHPAHQSTASAMHLLRELAIALRVPLATHAFAEREGVQA